MNSRWLSTSRSSRAVISLNVRASRCCSALPSGLARAERSPSATRRAASSSRRTGPATWLAIRAPAPSPSTSTTSPIATRPSVARRVARLTASTLWVTRTAPAGCVGARPGSAPRWRGSSRRASRCGAGPARRRRAGRRRPPAGCGSRCRAAPDPRSRRAGARSGRRRSPGRAAASAARATTPWSSAGRRGSTVDARNSAWLRACDFTSPSIRSRRLMISGTSRAMIASTST